MALELDHRKILSWYERTRRDLTGRGLWLLGGEPNSQVPGVFEGARLRILIARLSTYQDVASGATHWYLYQMARAVSGTFVDLAFLPPARDEERLLGDGIPLWIGTTTKRPPCDFDLVAISNSIVQELLNLPALLKLSGVPLSREERERTGAPLIILGGSNSYACSVLNGPIGNGVHGEGLVDGILVGDGEGVFAQILEIISREKGADRREILRLLRSSVRGFYDPSGYRQIFDEAGRLSKIEHAADAPMPVAANRLHHDPSVPTAGFTGGLIPYDEDAAGSSHLLVTSGCPYFCSFCKESWEQKPYRERPVDALIREALEQKARLGLSEIALLTFNAGTCSGLFELLDGLEECFDRVAIKSQRFDGIGMAPALLRRQLSAGKKVYTCAMEGISSRLRKWLQKNLSDELLFRGFEELFRNNIRQMKVFVILTGLESQADFQEFGETLARLKGMLSGIKGRPILTFSLAALFRPPRTPLQFAPSIDDPAAWTALFRKAEETIGIAGFEVRTSAGYTDALLSERLAYSDRRFTKVLVEGSVSRGWRYRGEVDRKIPEEWDRSGKRQSLPPARPGENAGATTVFPWDDIDCGVSGEFLEKNFRLLERGTELRSCLPEPFGSGVCGACGACTRPADRAAILGWKQGKPLPAPGGGTAPVRFFLEGRVPKRWADCGNGFLHAAFTRVLLGAFPYLDRLFLRFEAGIDRAGAYGYFRSEFLLRPEFRIRKGFPAFPPPGGFPFLIEPDGVAIDSIGELVRSREGAVAHGGRRAPISPGWRSFGGPLPPLTANLHFRAPLEHLPLSRVVDGFLARYSIKHQKHWVGETLIWEVPTGHAKKSGIRRLSWVKGAQVLGIDLVRWLPAHFLAILGEGAEIELLPPLG